MLGQSARNAEMYPIAQLTINAPRVMMAIVWWVANGSPNAVRGPVRQVKEFIARTVWLNLSALLQTSVLHAMTAMSYF